MINILNKSETLKFLIFFVSLIGAVLFFQSSASAATISVDTLDGMEAVNGNCSLPDAIRAAQFDSAYDLCVSGSGADIINIDVPGTISGLAWMIISTDITIQGNGGGTALEFTGWGIDIRLAGSDGGSGASFVTINDVSITDVTLGAILIAQPENYVYIDPAYIDPFAVTLNRVRIHDNNATGLRPGALRYERDETSNRPGKVYVYDSIIENNSGAYGSIYVNECRPFVTGDTLEIHNSIIRNNSATPATTGYSGYGGGIHMLCGHLKIDNSSIYGNSADVSGGGIFVPQPPATFTSLIEITNSTIAGNTAGNEGGGIWTGSPDVSLSLKHATIAGNMATTTGGIHSSSDDLEIFNTVIADNNSDQCNFTSSLVSNVANASSDSSCGFAFENITSGLGALSDNGGTADIGPNGGMGNILTMAIDQTSPLFNKANTSECLATDQTSTTRPQAYLCDIGAYETTANFKIGSYVWEDTNGNGEKDDNEPGIENVTLDLIDSNDVPINTKSTDSNGKYTFNVTPGTWKVKVTDTGKVLGARTASTDTELVFNVTTADITNNNFGYLLGATSDPSTGAASNPSAPPTGVGSLMTNNLVVLIATTASGLCLFGFRYAKR